MIVHHIYATKHGKRALVGTRTIADQSTDSIKKYALQNAYIKQLEKAGFYIEIESRDTDNVRKKMD
jgi:hypothetical protein